MRSREVSRSTTPSRVQRPWELLISASLSLFLAFSIHRFHKFFFFLLFFLSVCATKWPTWLALLCALCAPIRMNINMGGAASLAGIDVRRHDMLLRKLKIMKNKKLSRIFLKKWGGGVSARLFENILYSNNARLYKSVICMNA